MEDEFDAMLEAKDADVMRAVYEKMCNEPLCADEAASGERFCKEHAPVAAKRGLFSWKGTAADVKKL